MSIEEVEKQIRESAPLSDRLTDCKDRIGKMCAEGRPPKMSIPSQWNDDDLFICTTLSDAQAVEREKDEELAWMMNRNIDLERMWNASERYAKHCVTTIEETEAALAAAQEKVKELEAENKRLRKLVDGARVIVEVFQWSTPAQERWREEWLKKAAKAMEEASHEGR
jgi:hypothetical protein